MSEREKREERRGKLSGRERAEQHKGAFDRKAFRVPDGMKVFSISKDCVKTFDIIPYTVPKGMGRETPGGNPYRGEGELSAERTFFTHARIGANEDSYTCPSKTAGKPCPICEHRQMLVKTAEAGDEARKKLIASLAPKERQLWLIYDHDEPDKGVQLWEISFHLFGKQLDARVKRSSESSGYEYYADPDEGSTLRVGFTQKSLQKNDYYECDSIDFERRGKPLDAKLLNAAIVLDTLILIEPYEKLKAIYFQSGEEDTGAEEATERRGAREGGGMKPSAQTETKVEPKKEEPPFEEPKKKIPTAAEYGIVKGMQVGYKDKGLCEVMKVSPDGTSLTLLTATEDLVKAVGVAEVTVPSKAPSSPAVAPKAETPAPQATNGSTAPKADPAPVVEPASVGGDWDADWGK